MVLGNMPPRPGTGNRLACDTHSRRQPQRHADAEAAEHTLGCSNGSGPRHGTDSTNDKGTPIVKLVTAIISEHRLGTVKAALLAFGVPELSVSEAGVRLAGEARTYRGTVYEVDIFPRLRIEVLCDFLDAEDIARVIASAVRTEVGGGEKVWVSDIDLVIPVSTCPYGAVV